MRIRNQHLLAAAITALVVLSAACTRADATTSYTPGLGEIMALTQMRHAKLWLAGQAENWQLADYEVDELEEGLHDAVTFHPQHKSSPMPLTEIIPAKTGEPIASLRAAVAHKDGQAFTKAFDALTAACNSCHEATNFAFNVVIRPPGSSFLNQDFAPRRKGG